MIFVIIFPIHRFSSMFMSTLSYFIYQMLIPLSWCVPFYYFLYHQQGIFQIYFLFFFSMVILYIASFWYLNYAFINLIFDVRLQLPYFKSLTFICNFWHVHMVEKSTFYAFHFDHGGVRWPLIYLFWVTYVYSIFLILLTLIICTFNCVS